MSGKNYLYFYNYDSNESNLCKLESKFLFGKEEMDKILLSSIKFNPSNSAFIKKRLDIISFSEDYQDLLTKIQIQNIHSEGFKVEYLVLKDDSSSYNERLEKLRDIGYLIEGDPDYHHPVQTFALCLYEHCWYFGLLIKNSFDWHKHNQKPCSYSNSLSAAIAKTLANIASKGNPAVKILDACCGVGTILLEACFAGYSIDGCDINEKICDDARQNLAHYNYTATIYNTDIQYLTNSYDTAIIDLPYNLFSHADDELLLHIIQHTAKRSNRLIIISISDITHLIRQTGLIQTEFCTLTKRRKANVTRNIWVCEKQVSL